VRVRAGPEQELSLLCAFLEVYSLLGAAALHITFIGPEVPTELHGKAVFVPAGAIPHQPPGASGGAHAPHPDPGLHMSFYQGCYHDLMEDRKHLEGARDATDGQESLLGSGHAGGGGPAGRAAPPVSLVMAPNAGLPVYGSWLPSLHLLTQPSAPHGAAREGRLPPVVFTDYCEEAALRSGQLLQEALRCPLSVPVQVNPFRSAVHSSHSGTALPCYSNCYMFGVN
jgi:zinc finger MYND domain-containing protein 15